MVQATPDSRLEQLAARFETAKALADQTAAELKEITDGIKAELSRLHPGEREVILTSPFLTNPLQMQAVTSWRVDAKALKAKDPVTYTLYAKQSTSMRLAPLKAG